MDITYQYSLKRACFGKQPMFCEQGPEMCDSILVNPAEYKHYILRNPVHQPTQHAPRHSLHDANTIRAEYTTTGANHAEGGWPKDVNVTDVEATQRYKRKIEKDDNYIHCVMSSASGMEHYALQNNAIDMYRTYYVEMPPEPEPERVGCRTVNVFRDPLGARPVGSICWQPDGGRRFAVTSALLDFDREPRALTPCHVWNVEVAGQPEWTLVPASPLLDLAYNPREGDQLAGALASGRVALWDARRGPDAVAACPPHVAHRDLARCVLFVTAKSGREFFSSGPDGCVKWWDARDMSEPVDEMVLDVVKASFDVPSMANAHGVSALEFEPTIPTRFMAGSEDGQIIGGNRKGKTPLERLPFKFTAHSGPVWSVERNPGFLKNFLTVGDWTARVWSEDCRESAVLWSPPQRHKITAGTWSPIRLSLMMLTQWDGTLALWDLLRRQHEPVLTARVSREPLLRVRAHEAGSLIACGSQSGNVYMLELSESLSRSDKYDKSLLTAMFERESKRERILEARLREIRLKQRQAEEGSPRTSLGEPDPALGDRDLAEATADYYAVVKKETAAL